ncbi:MAG TPA: T9SS type A sorting domain-containing protein, partial [Hymenobacter sp.]|nr:T9SS type A sorting domain-containing protein [Hymenobacter sp.]
TAGVFFPAQTATVRINAGDMGQYFGTECNTSGVYGELAATFYGPVSVGSISGSGGVSGNTITWNVSDMSLPGYFVLFGVDSTAQAGDPICLDITLTPSSGTDNNPSNNTLSHCFTVVNSYDPNFKEVYPTTPQPSSWYTYTVHFQNTGTAAAQHIVIKDTLDANLDWSSFQRLGASHNDLTQVFENGIVHFNFPNINLPDSNSNEPDSHGWVQYRVKSKSTVDPLSTTIHNTASIYFDFNAPIVTNDALVEPATGILNTAQPNFELYPNPTADHVTIVLPKEHPNALVAVYDLTGREVLSTAPVNAQARLQTRLLSFGVYHVAMLVNGKSIGGKKLVVVR